MSTPKRFRFTNQLIKSLPPNTSDARSTDAEYSDTEISGLKCLVSRREGRKKFLLRYLYHGRKRAIAIGHWPEVDVNLARQIAIEHKRSLATGTDPKQERENKRMELTFDELFNQHYLPWAKSANGDIVHLDGDGTVIKSKAKGFLDRLDGWNSAISVYTDCMGLTPQGCARAAERAKAAVGQRYPYSLLDFNCHRFTARCVTGDSCPDIWLARHLDSFQKGDRWRVWQR